MQLHNLKRTHRYRKSKTVGRGGKRGKTSGRGTKGQNARAGHKKRPEVRDTIKKLPKLRGRGVNALRSLQPHAYTVIAAELEARFAVHGLVNPQTLDLPRGARVKILGDGVLTKPLTVKDCLVSGSAKAKIVAAGGSILVTGNQ